MSKNDLYESLTSDKLITSNFPTNPENNNDNIENTERVSNASFHSLEYTTTGEYNTLNEPISTSLKREFVRIFNKTQYSILPRCFPSKNANLRQWDLWGPLFYTLLLSFFYRIQKIQMRCQKPLCLFLF